MQSLAHIPSACAEKGHKLLWWFQSSPRPRVEESWDSENVTQPNYKRCVNGNADRAIKRRKDMEELSMHMT